MVLSYIKKQLHQGIFWKFIEKVVIVEVLLGTNLIFYKSYFYQNLTEKYLGLLLTSKIEKFGIIVHG